jgi:riboflavin synthase
MFTGIIKSVGSIDSWLEGVLWVQLGPEMDSQTIELGESIAVNGVCLTVVEIEDTKVRFDLSPETVQKTTFSEIGDGESVNLERALALGDRLGGHMVQGHVDGIGTLVSAVEDGNSTILKFEVPEDQYLVEKGSICIDGISLTVVNLQGKSFEVWVIPHTLDHSNLKARKVGSKVNIEYDVMNKYLYRLYAQSNHLKSN